MNGHDQGGRIREGDEQRDMRPKDVSERGGRASVARGHHDRVEIHDGAAGDLARVIATDDLELHAGFRLRLSHSHSVYGTAYGRIYRVFTVARTNTLSFVPIPTIGGCGSLTRASITNPPSVNSDAIAFS